MWPTDRGHIPRILYSTDCIQCLWWKKQNEKDKPNRTKTKKDFKSRIERTFDFSPILEMWLFCSMFVHITIVSVFCIHFSFGIMKPSSNVMCCYEIEEKKKHSTPTHTHNVRMTCYRYFDSIQILSSFSFQSIRSCDIRCLVFDTRDLPDQTVMYVNVKTDSYRKIKHYRKRKKIFCFIG